MPRKSIATPQKPKVIEEDEQSDKPNVQTEVTNENPVQKVDNTASEEHATTPRKRAARTPSKRTPKPQPPKLAPESPASAPSATPSKAKAAEPAPELQTPKRPRLEPPKEVTETPMPPAVEQEEEEEIDPFDFAGEDNEVPEAISTKAGQEQSEKLSANIKAEEKKFAEEQKIKKKLFQKPSKKVHEQEALPADILEQAALEQDEISANEEKEDGDKEKTEQQQNQGTKKPQHKYFIEKEAVKQISQKNVQATQGTSIYSGISIVNISEANSSSTLPQKSAQEFLQNALYGGKQRRDSNISPKGGQPALSFVVDDIRKKNNEKRRMNELRDTIRVTRGKKRNEMIKMFKQWKEKNQ